MSDKPKVKLYLYFISNDTKSHDHVTRFVDLLQYTESLGEEGGRIRPAILRDCSTEILLIAVKKIKINRVLLSKTSFYFFSSTYRIHKGNIKPILITKFKGYPKFR